MRQAAATVCAARHRGRYAGDGAPAVAQVVRGARDAGEPTVNEVRFEEWCACGAHVIITGRDSLAILYERGDWSKRHEGHGDGWRVFRTWNDLLGGPFEGTLPIP